MLRAAKPAALPVPGLFLASAKPAILLEINSTALEAAGSSREMLASMLNGSGYDRYLNSDGDLNRYYPLTAQVPDSNIIALQHFHELNHLYATGR